MSTTRAQENVLASAQPPASRPGDRRSVIVEAALTLIAEGGVDAVTHRKVAAAAGVPLGSTTYYFESRAHLIRAAFDHYLERVQRLQAEIGAPDGSNAQALVDFLVAFAEREAQERSYLRAEYEMTLFAARDPVLAATLERWLESMVGQMADALARAGARAPEEAARSVLDLMRGFELSQLTRSAPDPTLRHRLGALLSAYLPSE
ncbi:MAG: TetR family transcriptional regulator [Pseudomonadota bacterium]